MYVILEVYIKQEKNTHVQRNKHFETQKFECECNFRGYIKQEKNHTYVQRNKNMCTSYTHGHN